MNRNLLRRLDLLERHRVAKVPPLEIILDFTGGETDPEKIARVSTRTRDLIVETVLRLRSAEPEDANVRPWTKKS